MSYTKRIVGNMALVNKGQDKYAHARSVMTFIVRTLRVRSADGNVKTFLGMRMRGLS